MRFTGQGIHPAQTGSLYPARTSRKRHHPLRISIDQMMANHVGEEIPQSSIVLACEQP